MLIDLNPEGGGVVVEGSGQELTDFAEAILEVVSGGEEEAGAWLTEEGVEPVFIRCIEDPT